ncbi:MAG: hypothetical protein ACJ77H_05865 [Actinomycetota bacterium]|jgi:hypothetical protein
MTTSSMEHGVELVVAVDLGQQALEGAQPVAELTIAAIRRSGSRRSSRTSPWSAVHRRSHCERDRTLAGRTAAMAVSNPEEERNRAFGVFPSVAVPG